MPTVPNQQGTPPQQLQQDYFHRLQDRKHVTRLAVIVDSSARKRSLSFETHEQTEKKAELPNCLRSE